MENNIIDLDYVRRACQDFNPAKYDYAATAEFMLGRLYDGR